MRDPKRLFARYGRQLLVDGADFDGQARLHGWTVALAADASVFAQAAAEAAGRYLVGAGVGAVVAPTAFAAALQDLDPELQLRDGPDATSPPVAHYWFASRPYGASVDVTVTDAGEVANQPARLATLQLQVSEPASADLAVALGAAAAELLLADVLHLEPLPALVTLDWTDPIAPTRTTRARMDQALPMPRLAAPSRLLAELRAADDVWQVIVAEVERGYPDETCGLLVRLPGGALAAIVCPNLQNRYHEADPREFPRTARTAYRLDERVIAQSANRRESLVAIWHAHCDAGAYFSAEDVRCAAPDGQPLYPGVAYLVLSALGGRVRDAAVHRFDAVAGAFVAEAVASSGPPSP